MSPSESDARSKLIDPKLDKRGWIEDHIQREETAGTLLPIGAKGKPRRGMTDYTLRLKIDADSQPVAVAVIEAKTEKHAHADGLEQARFYGASRLAAVKRMPAAAPRKAFTGEI